MTARRRALIALCITEVTSWGVLYYAFPVMLPQVTRATGWSAGSAMGAFSTGLVVAALAGMAVGRALDRYGPRPVMATGSVVGVAATLAIAAAPSLPWFYTAWALAGLAESALLYTPAFSALTRWYGPDRVRALTTLSLVAGLASTIYAPLAAALASRLDWRATFVVLAALLGAITLPLHVRYLSVPWPPDEGAHHAPEPAHLRMVVGERAFAFLVVAMALAAFGMYAANLNLVPLLVSRGMSSGLAAVALGLGGAGQVLGRLGYAALTRRTSPRARTVAILASGAAAVAMIAAVPGHIILTIAVVVVAGCVRGVFTLLQATAISDRWGTRRFATLNGVFSAPTTAATAVAPAGGAVLAGWLGGYPVAFWMLSALVFAGALTAIGTTVGNRVIVKTDRP